MQAAPIWAEGEPASYSVTWPSLLSVKGGAYELYYRGALGEMNITGKPTDDPNSTDKPSELKHDALTKTVGAKLAEAYAEAVAPSHFVQSLSNATIVRKEDIADFIPYGCICNVSNFEKERRALIDAFFRFDSPDAYAVKRLASLCLFLDIVKNSEGEPLNEDHFRQLLYFWSYGTHHRYDPEGNLLLQAERWRAFQFRQYFVYAYELLWSFFLSSIFGDKKTAHEFLAEIRASLDLAALSKKYKLGLASSDAAQIKLGDFMNAIKEHLSLEELLTGPRPHKTP